MSKLALYSNLRSKVVEPIAFYCLSENMRIVSAFILQKINNVTKIKTGGRVRWRKNMTELPTSLIHSL